MSERLAKRVLLIGWDAADWQVAAPLMDEGKMPHLERFVSEGVMGNISTLFPALSPMLWTSIATGKRAHRHGIHGFAEPDPKSGGVRPITSLGRKCKALWNILSQQGLKSNVVGWWPSFPAEPIHGVMVANHFQEATGATDNSRPLRPGMVWPPEKSEGLARLRIHPTEILAQDVELFIPRLAELDQDQEKRLSAFVKILAETSTIQAVATALMQHEPWDFMGVYFDGIDHFCHGFMRFHPPRLPWIRERDFEFYKEVVTGAYRFHDMLLGVLLELAGPETTVILMSDHGFESGALRVRELPNEPAGPADDHRSYGMLAMRGPGLKRDELIHGANLLDIAPTVLTLLGLPVGRDMDGRVLTSAFTTPPEVESIESWEQVPGEAGQHPPDAQIDMVDAHESLKQLVALGYIEKPDEDRERAAQRTIRELRYNLARSHLSAHMLPEAIALLTELWKDFPDEGRFGVKLFEAQLQLRRTDEARQTLGRLIESKDHFSAIARENLAKLQEEWKDRSASDLTVEEHRRLNDLKHRSQVNELALTYFRGSLLHAEGRLQEAFQELLGASRVQYRNLPSLYSKLGDCCIGLQRFDEAVDWYGKMLELAPVNPTARLGLARAYLGKRDHQQALEQAIAGVGQGYHNPAAHYLCARVLRRLGRHAEAIQSLETALSFNSVFPEAQRLLAALYLKMGQPERAAKHRDLSRAAADRIAAYRAGAPRLEDTDISLDVDWHRPARIGEVWNALAGHPVSDETVVIVSGLPRSGTSMMMQLLAAGGIPILADGAREADADNPRGYLEYEAAKKAKDSSWIREARGKGVKLVAQLLSNLVSGPDYRIIFMERNLGEVVASQSAMLRRQNVAGGTLSDRRLAATYRAQIEAARRDLKRLGKRCSVLGINYQEALGDPEGTARRVNAFLGGTFDEQAMRGAIDPSLRRQKVEPAEATP
ncbi:MAG: alkaline phosphatase family protein [Planctomycetaceae bacterium]|jgi:predicted AlkP superfamily phosphohydrolase/phosphomutase/tetratricopeptide (TPR) repeat protein